MTEAEWLACDIPGSLLSFIVEAGLSSRKVRLYEDACDRIDRQEAVSTQQPTWGACPAIDVIRDIFGNPFRPVTADPAWLTSDVVALATSIYAEKAFDRLPILADALQDAGCDNADVLDHCRSDGPHVRGCWVVDLLLGKP